MARHGSEKIRGRRVVGTVTLHHLLHARRHDLAEEHHRQRLLPGYRRRAPDAVPT
ncbi:hypothetical protein [Streptomyces noursei]|uniref:hypothetical protein n=1 Tax=Streptomyces noursei TaxID=1971 RepID=UPI0013520EA0